MILSAKNRNVLKAFLFLTLCFLSNSGFAQTEHSFTNPIFPGDYPDPSILVDGSDYYVVHSSFEYNPGLLIWHSTDLINWEPLTNALTKYVGSVYAPDIVKYDGRYFIYFPAAGSNFVVWADDISGPWSDPIDLKVGNIDPGHITDDEGNRYLYFSNGGYVPLSKDGLSVTGELVPSYEGWPIPREWVIECMCLEGPKLMKHGDYYYLTVAEGGTAGPATGHMVISARSKSPLGPWENSPYNPIIRTKSADERWASVGHGTVFEDAKDNWWMIFHGYEKNHYNMGRQSLVAPVEWTEDGWFKIPDSFDLSEPVAMPSPVSKVSDFNFSDDFEGSKLNPFWKFFKEYDTDRFSVSDGALHVKGKGSSIYESAPLLVMPADHSYTAEIEMELEGDATGGLIMYYDDRAFSGILANSEDIMINLRGWQFISDRGVSKRHVFLRLENRNDVVNLYHSTDGKNWIKNETSLEVSAFHHNVLSGFMALRIGLISLGEGTVHFKNFSYQPIQE